MKIESKTVYLWHTTWYNIKIYIYFQFYICPFMFSVVLRAPLYQWCVLPSLMWASLRRSKWNPAPCCCCSWSFCCCCCCCCGCCCGCCGCCGSHSWRELSRYSHIINREYLNSRVIEYTYYIFKLYLSIHQYCKYYIYIFWYWPPRYQTIPSNH